MAEDTLVAPTDGVDGLPCVEKVPLSKIQRDPACRSRAGQPNPVVVGEFADAIRNGTDFPPVDLFFDDDGKYWPGDGHYRIAATELAGRGDILARVRPGGKREAILFGCGANATHGLRRTNRDKRKAVLTLLADPIWSNWSNREVARRCGVVEAYVRKLKGEGAHNAHETGPGSLRERFLVPPFTVLDARQGWWQARKRLWFALGIRSELGRIEA